MLATHDIDKFNIILYDNYEEMCDIMNMLQKESFEINVVMLDYITTNYNALIRMGLLLPKALGSINITAAPKDFREA